MNDYIFDWAENSEKILAGGGYTTKVHQTFEQIMLFAYLREKGYSKDEIFSLWIETNSLLLQKIGDDKDQRDKYFGKLFADSTKYKIEKGNRIDIYQSEIDFINNMEVSMWIKQYVLAMLCIYKWYGKEWCVYNDKIKRFCYSCTDIKRDSNESRSRLLSNCVNDFSPYILRNMGIQVVFKFRNIKKDIIAITIPNPRHVLDVNKLLHCLKVCESCGSIFNYDYHTKHMGICKKCYTEMRKRGHRWAPVRISYDIENAKINPNKES